MFIWSKIILILNETKMLLFQGNFLKIRLWVDAIQWLKHINREILLWRYVNNIILIILILYFCWYIKSCHLCPIQFFVNFSFRLLVQCILCVLWKKVLSSAHYIAKIIHNLGKWTYIFVNFLLKYALICISGLKS